MNRFLHQVPLIRVALPMMLGVILAISVDWEGLSFFYTYATVLGLLAIIFIYRKKWKYPRNFSRFGLIYSGAFLICGYGLASQHELAHKKKIRIPESVKTAQARLQEPLREGPNSIYGTFELLNYWDGHRYRRGNRFLFILYAARDSVIRVMNPGDEIVFDGEIQAHRYPINPHQFNYAAHLERKGVGGSVYVGKDFQIIPSKSHRWRLENSFQVLQLKCMDALKKSGMDEKERSVLNALVLGYRSDLKTETKTQFADAGVVHILAVSGLHVGIIFIVIQWILKRTIGSRLPYIQFIIVIFIIWLYAGITGFSPSVLRASTMFSFIAFGSMGGNKGNTYNMLAASIILLLLINPLIIKEIGFQLSYLAVIGIVFFHDIFKPLFWSKYWIIQKAWELFVVSVSAQIATAALSIYYFGQFPNYFFLSNLLVIPLATLSLYSGLLYLIVHSIPFLGHLVALITNLVVSSLTWVVALFSNLPGSVSQGIHFTILDVLGIYVLIVLIILIGERPNKLRLRLACAAIVVLAASHSFRQISAAIKSDLYILEGKKGSVALLRSGRSGIFIPLYKESQNSSFQENEYYLSEFIRNEGIKELHWIGHIPTRSNAYLVYEGFVCFRDDILIYSKSSVELPPTESRVIVLSKDTRPEDFQLDEFNQIILDRTFKDYKKEKLYRSLSDSSLVWDMDRQGIFRKSYSDFNF